MRSLLSLFNRTKSDNVLAFQKPVKADFASASNAERGFEWVKTSDDPRHMRRMFEADIGAISSVSRLVDHINEQGEGARRIAFVSSESGMEASAISIALGRKMAIDPLRVVALDMAISNPFLSKLVSTEAIGLCDVLRGENSIAESILGDDRSNLNIIPVGMTRMTLEAVFNNEHLPDVLEAVSLAYDRILLDFGAANSRFYADKIAAIATFVVVVGRGDDKHRRLIELYKRYDKTLDMAIILADAVVEERRAA
jgi:Mrp family chromosome partitioning ATPase